jgi:hypothetical protein
VQNVVTVTLLLLDRVVFTGALLGAWVGVAPELMLLVAVHPWDIHGAAQAGMGTAWVNRTGA